MVSALAPSSASAVSVVCIGEKERVEHTVSPEVFESIDTNVSHWRLEKDKVAIKVKLVVSTGQRG